jgi:hypothetical protein
MALDWDAKPRHTRFQAVRVCTEWERAWLAVREDDDEFDELHHLRQLLVHPIALQRRLLCESLDVVSEDQSRRTAALDALRSSRAAVQGLHEALAANLMRLRRSERASNAQPPPAVLVLTDSIQRTAPPPPRPGRAIAA